MTATPQGASIPPESDPQSGVRSRCTATDLDRFARAQLDHTHRWVCDLGIHEQDVEDLLQDAFIVMVEKAGRLPPEMLASWFRGVVRNKSRHFRRAMAVARKYEPLLQAHLGSPDSPYAAPDADVARRQALAAVFWLVEQVHDSRREVAERYLLDDESLPQIVESTGQPRGTILARWAHAKEDMRAAIERERSKQGTTRWLVLLAALVESLWLLLLANGRRFAGALAEVGGRAFGRRRPHDDARRERTTSDRGGRRSSRAGSLLACGVLPLALLSHVALEIPPPPVAHLAASFVAIASAQMETARHELDQAEGVEPRDLAPPHNTAHAAAAARAPVRMSVAGSPAHATKPSAAPSSRAAPSVKAAPSSVPPEVSAREPSSSPDLDMARNLLLRATTSYEEGNIAIAKAALKQYRRMFPENPYPALYERAALVEHSR